MKLLIDMNLSPRWVDALRAAGLPAEHWSAIGRPDATDAELFDHARRNGMAIVTSDLDFSAILAATASRRSSPRRAAFRRASSSCDRTRWRPRRSRPP